MRSAGPLRWLALSALLLACSDRAPRGPESAPAPAPAAAEARGGSPGARRDVAEAMRQSRELRFAPADGGGRAWLEGSAPPRLVAGTPGHFTLVYEAGPLGVAEGGMIFLQVSPFWGWSTPQVQAPDDLGYTLATTDAEGVELAPETLDQQLLGIRVGGRALAAGERVRIAYGAGPAGALVDRFACRGSHFWIAVDGDGDGVRKVIEDSPSIDVAAGAPARLRVTLPSVARPGETVRMCIAVLDALGSRGTDFAGEVALDGGGDAIELPRRVTFAAADGGVKVLEVRAGASGTARVHATASADLEATSNPLEVTSDGPRVLWADLHGHSGLSDGTGTPEDYYSYARDVSCLDAAALTDHDHWGILPLDTHPALWEEIRQQERHFHEPGRFVTLLGFEWTSWIYGHRHVLYFGDEGDLYSSLDADSETPQQLWKALDGRSALTFAHHSAGGPIATDWSIPPDPRFEPVTEIASVHGSSEAPDTPFPIYSAVPGNYVRDALARGYRLGFIGSGDSHDGHPGLAQLAAPSSGLAAVLSEERTREGLLAALGARRVYATNGARILLRMALGPHRMGSSVRVTSRSGLTDRLFVRAVGTAPIQRIDLVRSGHVVDSVDAGGRLEIAAERPVEDLRSGEYIYVRVVQQDGGAAWSSPIFIE
jgi:hypothetical protein